MPFAIYTITNKINGKQYVGITGDIKRRWREHRRVDGFCPVLHAAMKKHGIDNFEFTHIADAFTWKDACFLENEFIVSMQTKSPSGYNLTLGGDGTLGFKHTIEERQRRSQRCPTRDPYLKEIIFAKQRGVPRPQTSGINNAMYGRTGLKSHVLKGVIVATNLSDGSVLKLAGAKEIESAGFNRSHVYGCVNRKRKTHKNHSFEFIGEV